MEFPIVGGRILVLTNRPADYRFPASLVIARTPPRAICTPFLSFERAKEFADLLRRHRPSMDVSVVNMSRPNDDGFRANERIIEGAGQ